MLLSFYDHIVHILIDVVAKKYQELHGQAKPEKKKPEKKVAEKPKVCYAHPLNIMTMIAICCFSVSDVNLCLFMQ